jgi:hypothetical protein
MAVVSAIGSFLSSKSQNKANARAADTSERNNQANVALARDIYGQNKAILSPFVQRGDTAGNALNALLGLGGSPAPMQPSAPATFGQPAGAAYGIGDSAMLGNGIAPTMTGSNPMTGQMPQQTAQQAQNAAFDNFRNSTGYQFRLGEGLDAVSSAYAGIGGLQSGAAMRGINEYGQNFASNEFGNYAGLLSNQQAVGAGAGSALAGVGQNFAGTVIGANNFNAQNQMQAQLGRQNPFANALGTFGGGMQQAAGTFLGGGFG